MKAMKAKALSLALLAACLAGPASPLLAAETAAPAVRVAAINTPDPTQQIKDMARLFRAGDVAGMARAAVPPSHWDMARGAWEVKRMEPTTAHDRENATSSDLSVRRAASTAAGSRTTRRTARQR